MTETTTGNPHGSLYIIRHGRTDWNDLRKLQGRTDIPLNEEGRRMAAEAAKEYADIPFDICFCSPLVRAKETAEILLRDRDVPIEYDDRLMEMSFGIYEGVQYSFSIPDCPVNRFFDHPETYTDAVEGGESTPELMARTGSFLCEKVYPRLRRGENVLIVGHGAMNSSIICNVRNLPLTEFWSVGIENCKLKKLM
ncbi:MAG: histidine phosphatase family protein [Lachnospiraceae bacterium]|nr:histidine phosphatase family protein [Lachnospiraceae bacterium]